MAAAAAVLSVGRLGLLIASWLVREFGDAVISSPILWQEMTGQVRAEQCRSINQALLNDYFLLQ